MAVSSRHPRYADFVVDWEDMRFVAKGEKAVKGEGVRYLPQPSGFSAQADGGVGMYLAYATRAQFPELIQPTLGGMVGIIHRKEVTVDGLPKAMEPLWERATLDGLTLEALHRRITTELLLVGRYSLLPDLPTEGGDLPYFVGYEAEALINWDEEQTLYVLDETRQILNPEDFSWRNRKQHRVLRLIDGKYVVQKYGEDETRYDEVTPTARGGAPLSEIPLVTMTARDLTAEPEAPPLSGVARASLAIYRLDADYRHQLFNSGQETLFVIGADADESGKPKLPNAVGAGVVHGLPIGGDAKYVGPTGAGISAHRTAIQDEFARAASAGAALFADPTGGGGAASQESGDAKSLRYAAQTASLTTVAQTSAQGLERALRHAARMIGTPEAQVLKIIVTPDLDFLDNALAPSEAVQLVQLWQSGAIAKVTLYENLQRGGIASPERTHDEEEELIAAEVIDQPMVPGVGDGSGVAGDTGNVSDAELAALFSPDLLGGAAP